MSPACQDERMRRRNSKVLNFNFIAKTILLDARGRAEIPGITEFKFSIPGVNILIHIYCI